ncbi:MAG: transglutaminase-like domain-containing protein [Candidatus Accumulibacter sp.]|nr:transglutaminase-like domain-containing protein [Accumulibacter sp.]
MKRRRFVTAAVLSLLTSPLAQAAPAAKTGTKPTAKHAPKKTVRSAAKKPAAKHTSAAAKSTQTPDNASHAIVLPDEPPPQWRSYELRTSITLNNANGPARLWLPLVQYRDTPWERSFGHRWQGNHAMAGIYRDPVADMEIFYADWSEDIAEPTLEIVSHFATQDRQFDITHRGVSPERGEILRRCLQATEATPTGGIVRRTAEQAVGRIKDPLAQAKAIYDWVVENTRYDPSAQAANHTAALLESGQLTGSGIAIALLFVGLCRAIGIPARPAFGLRIDRSRLFGSLGVSGELNASPHCRAEFYSPGYGWIPVDPADVRQAILDENLNPADPRLTVLKKLLFGFWEMNWIGFNTALDVLPHGTSKGALPFLIAPLIETGAGRFDDPASGSFSCSVGALRI